MQAVLVPPPLARSIRLCFTGGQVRVIGAELATLTPTGAALTSATLTFSAGANTGADHTNNKLQLSREWPVQSDIFDIHAVHAN